MEVVAIKKSTLEEMNDELRGLLEMIKNATQKYTPIFKKEKWLDNQEVCVMLNISKRTLQTYKNKGWLSYSKLNRKNYFKLSDAQALLKDGQLPNMDDDGFMDR